jgi:hypothetical protein
LHKPLVATSDAHSFKFFGRHFCRIDADKDVRSVLDAIRKGRVENVSKPLRLIDGLYLVGVAVCNKFRSITGLRGDRAF